MLNWFIEPGWPCQLATGHAAANCFNDGTYWPGKVHGLLVEISGTRALLTRYRSSKLRQASWMGVRSKWDGLYM